MNYIKIELRQGVPLDAFYPRVNNKINWENFGTSVQAIKLDTLVITGMKEADGDYVYLLPIANETKALECKVHMETYSQVSQVNILTEAEAIEERNLIIAYQQSLKSE